MSSDIAIHCTVSLLYHHVCEHPILNIKLYIKKFFAKYFDTFVVF